MTLTPTSPTSAGVSAATAACCTEYAGMSRRGLFRGVALAGATAVVGSAVVTAAPARAASADSVLVVLSLRGAADGLSMVVPHGDPVYYAARPRIAIPSDRLLAKDGMFGLHPKMAPLLPMWNAGRIAAVQATGLPVANRSHFSAMEELEDADPGSSTRQGWLNRLVGQLPGESPLQAFSIGGGVLPASMYGNADVMSAADVESMKIPGDDQYDKNGGRVSSLHTLWDDHDGPLGKAMRSAFTAVKEFAPVTRTNDGVAAYPRTDLGRALSEVARIIRGDVGVEVLTVDQGDWDHHSDLGTAEWGRMNRNVEDLAGSLAAFFGDLGSQASKVTVVTISEFGRRVKENANFGLDHGYGNVMLVAGAGVKGGTYYGRWPGLANETDADLLVTTDYRSVLSEVVSTRFGASTAQVFPAFSPTSVGVMSAV
ncbi:DUF1501 domain-containing protein [Nocardioides nanhaiensis]|uniref:DUF1501 domain-containing protein n=1 Tax=Nocardioides nanhaiensis TaxID=1476871 RepID=A0ABP8WND7_9ACTN